MEPKCIQTEESVWCDTSCMEWSETCSVRLGVDWTWQISSHCSDSGHNEAGETLFCVRGCLWSGQDVCGDSSGQPRSVSRSSAGDNSHHTTSLPAQPSRDHAPPVFRQKLGTAEANLSFGGQVLKEFTLPDAIFCPFPHVSMILPSILFGTCSNVTIVTRVSLVP